VLRRWSLKAAAVTPLAVAGLVAPAAMTGAAQAGAAAHAPHAGSVTLTARPAAVTGRRTGDSAGNRFCLGLGKRYQASSAAWSFCAGPQPHGPSGLGAHASPAGARVAGTPANVNAASFAEDVSPSGARGYGQSEVSIAASGPYVVQAWNDATGFFSACPSPKAQLTGFGFSSNGGKSFTDLQGLPDSLCSSDLFEGDPSVAAYRAGGQTYFYISSLFDSPTGLGRSFVALDACRVSGTGSHATLDCGQQPVIVAASTQCQQVKFGSRTFRFCSFLDKDFLAVDPAHGRLYASFTEFPLFGIGSRVQASVCDLGNLSGGTGPAGGTPARPVCEHGSHLVKISKTRFAGKPYLTVQAGDHAGCEYEGAYPAVDTATGDLYVGYEHNWGTNTSGFGKCAFTPTENIVAREVRHCLVLRSVSPCATPAGRAGVPVTSIDTAQLPGFLPSSLPNDFPRLAVTGGPPKLVAMVWNDTRFHGAGDILLQSFRLGSLRPVQHAPVVLDSPHHGGLSLEPAVRAASPGGLLDVSWYSRSSVATADTSVVAALNVSPVTTRTPRNTTITSVASNWDNSNSDIFPNFGDYTDSSFAVTGSRPFVSNTLYIAWSDGRTGVPQPFEAHLSVP
jgi:hypothetical protein